MLRGDVRPIKNDTGETIPACGVVESTGAIDPDTGALVVTKPTVNGGPVLVVGDVSIPANGLGQATNDNAVVVAYDPADGEPEIGQSWGPKAGSWRVHLGYVGFVLQALGTTGRMNAVRTGATGGMLVGYLDEEMVKDGDAVLSVWEFNGSADADTGRNVVIYDWLLKTGQVNSAGLKAVAAFIGGRWRLIETQCEDE